MKNELVLSFTKEYMENNIGTIAKQQDRLIPILENLS